MTNKTVNLENCEGFNFTLWEPAYCGGCEAWIPYNIKKGTPTIPKQCSSCGATLKISTGDPLGLILASSDGKVSKD